MILDVDVGNTRIKWRQSPDGPVQAVARQEEAALIQDWCTLPGLKRIRVASVASDAWRLNFRERCHTQVGVVPEYAQVIPGLGGLTSLYQSPETLGVDRWLAVLGARPHWLQQDCVLLDAGSALTVDLVTRAGRHLGGYIVPGLGVARQAFFTNAERVSPLDMSLTPNWRVGTSTRGCLESGFSALYGGFVQQVWQQGQTILNKPLLLCTGGDADQLTSLIPTSIPMRNESALVLDGLVIALP